MAFSGASTRVGGGDPPFASNLKGDSNKRFKFPEKL